MGRSVTIIEQTSSFDGAVAFGLCNGTDDYLKLRMGLGNDKMFMYFLVSFFLVSEICKVPCLNNQTIVHRAYCRR